MAGYFSASLRSSGRASAAKVERTADNNAREVVLVRVVHGLADGIGHTVGGLGVGVEACLLLQFLGAQCAGTVGRDGVDLGKAGGQIGHSISL